MNATGVDVSTWQGKIDWDEAVKFIDFAFVRCAYGTKVDALFLQNWEALERLNFVRGAYLYFRPTLTAEEQAQTFEDLVPRPRAVGCLPPVVDVEERIGGDWHDKLLALLDRLEEWAGCIPIVYTGPWFWGTTVGGDPRFARYALWVAHYDTLKPAVPRPWTQWSFWQHTDKGAVPGIKGHVDADWFNGSPDELRAIAHDTTVDSVDVEAHGRSINHGM